MLPGPFDVQQLAPTFPVPVLMIHSEKALMPALARKFYAALPGSKEQEWLSSNGQIDFYDDPQLIDPAADRVANFFDRVSAPGRGIDADR